MICLFGTRLGSPTGKSESGTVEEINEHVDAEKPVMVYFKNFIEDVSTLDKIQFEKVSEFKKQIQNGALYHDYKSVSDFSTHIKNHIEKVINDISSSFNIPTTTNLLNVDTPKFDESENDVLQKWVNSNRPDGFIMSTLGGKFYILGALQYQITKGKDEVEWNDFIERLEDAGFIQLGMDRKGNTTFQLKKAAYNYIKSLGKE
ncbi:MAG: hypothetical protein ACK5KL_13890 [Dysgonomonas sp.]